MFGSPKFQGVAFCRSTFSLISPGIYIFLEVLSIASARVLDNTRLDSLDSTTRELKGIKRRTFPHLTITSALPNSEKRRFGGGTLPFLEPKAFFFFKVIYVNSSSEPIHQLASSDKPKPFLTFSLISAEALGKVQIQQNYP